MIASREFWRAIARADCGKALPIHHTAEKSGVARPCAARQSAVFITGFPPTAGERRNTPADRTGGGKVIRMRWKLLRAAALVIVMGFGLQSQAARAEDNAILNFLFGHQDPRLTATGIGIGLASTGASYAMTHKHGVPAVRFASPGIAFAVTSFGCAAVYPIIGTLVLHRALTPREAYTGIADCVIPFIGGRIVDNALPHTAWYDGTPERHAVRAHHDRHHTH